MDKHTLIILECSPQDLKKMFQHFSTLSLKGLNWTGMNVLIKTLQQVQKQKLEFKEEA